MRISCLASFLSALVVVKTSVSESVAVDDYRHYSKRICKAKCTGTGSSEVCKFKFRINHSASELGYYTVDGCDGIMPVLGMKVGVQYRFIQKDETNYYHPLGFAYEADGAHAGVDELEPSIVPPGLSSSCGDDNTCPAPMYLKSGKNLGVYSNIAEIPPVRGDEDFGLDVYEPEFFASPPDWQSAGTYEVALKFDVVDYKKDIFYFCHIHQYMTGRIKFIDASGEAIQKANEPEIPYAYEKASAYDQSCGTYGIDAFKLPHAECPSEFVCNKAGSVSAFAGCVDSMNCAMTAGMTTNASSDNALALFIHQMIPHHQNAVNMAKALLKSGDLDCDDLTAEELSPACVLKQVCLEIITGQNHQIQSMRGVNEALEYVGEDDCKVQGSEVGSFTIVLARKFAGKEYCLQERGTTSKLFLRVCNGDATQKWTVDAKGRVKQGRVKNSVRKCISARGENLKMRPCKGVDSGNISKTFDGALAMNVNGKTKFIAFKSTPEGQKTVHLTDRRLNLGQRFHMKYV